MRSSSPARKPGDKAKCFWSNIYSSHRRKLMTQLRARPMACRRALEESADVGLRKSDQVSQVATRFGTLYCVLTLAVLSGTALAAKHPVPLEKNADSATCISCHEDKTKGKSVHSAIAMGCTSCHEIRTVKDITHVKLITATPSALCFTCHADKNPAD